MSGAAASSIAGPMRSPTRARLWPRQLARSTMRATLGVAFDDATQSTIAPLGGRSSPFASLHGRDIASHMRSGEAVTLFVEYAVGMWLVRPCEFVAVLQDADLV